MFGSSAALKAVQVENAALKLQIEELRKMVETLTERFDNDLDALIESKVDEGIRNIDLSDEIESAVDVIMRNATVSIDF